jgi:hypothetical protein
MVFIPNNYTPEILEPGKKSFNFPSATIASQFPPILGFWSFTAFAMWRYHFNSTFIKKPIIKRIAVICLVADQFFRCIRNKAIVNRYLNQLYFMGRSTFNVSGDRNTRSVCNCHDLGAFAAFRLADSRTPFFAGEKVPSMKASRMSMLPRSYRSSASSCVIRRKTPCLTHRWNRRWQVWYGGYRGGKSFQGAPVRKIHKTPFRTSLGSRDGRPLGSLGGVNSLIIGSNRFHCSFVISILIIFHNQIVMSSCFLGNHHIFFEMACTKNKVVRT